MANEVCSDFCAVAFEIAFWVSGVLEHYHLSLMKRRLASYYMDTLVVERLYSRLL